MAASPHARPTRALGAGGGAGEVDLAAMACNHDAQSLCWQAGKREVDLTDCRALEDIACLRDAEKLILRRCYSLRDASALGRVRHLVLADCRKLKDVACLGGVHHLDLSYAVLLGASWCCPLPFAVCCAPRRCESRAAWLLFMRAHASMLGQGPGAHVCALHRSSHLCAHCCAEAWRLGCDRRRPRSWGVPRRSTVRSTVLLLRGCSLVSDVSQLGSVDTLLLNGCTGVENVSALGSVRHLEIKAVQERYGGSIRTMQVRRFSSARTDTQHVRPPPTCAHAPRAGVKRRVDGLTKSRNLPALTFHAPPPTLRRCRPCRRWARSSTSTSLGATGQCRAQCPLPNAPSPLHAAVTWRAFAFVSACVGAPDTGRTWK